MELPMCVFDRAASLFTRFVALVVLPLVLAGCMSAPPQHAASYAPQAQQMGPDAFYVAMYGPRPNEMFPLPATDIRQGYSFVLADTVYQCVDVIPAPGERQAIFEAIG
jgi:hypothetical protein